VWAWQFLRPCGRCIVSHKLWNSISLFSFIPKFEKPNRISLLSAMSPYQRFSSSRRRHRRSSSLWRSILFPLRDGFVLRPFRGAPFFIFFAKLHSPSSLWCLCSQIGDISFHHLKIVIWGFHHLLHFFIFQLPFCSSASTPSHQQVSIFFKYVRSSELHYDKQSVVRL